ncbi:MAG: hypothetical protein ACK5L7_02335 [Paludibacteraceae bacterium]
MSIFLPEIFINVVEYLEGDKRIANTRYFNAPLADISFLRDDTLATNKGVTVCIAGNKW